MAGFNISDFSTVISNKGLHRPNKFLVRFSLPLTTLNSVGVGVNRELEFWCDSVTLPGFTIQPFPVLRYGYGVSEKIPNQPIFNDISLSVLADGKGDNWSLFKSWLDQILYFDKIINNDDIYELAYKYEYASDINILTFDDSGLQIQDIILKDAFPLNIGDVQFNWADNNNITRFNIILTYHSWYSNS